MELAKLLQILLPICVHIYSVGCDAARRLGNLTLTMEPEWVKRGHSAQLFCNYELQGVPLYSVKWYRGTLEFYRYSPFEHPPGKIFPYTGIKADLSVSNATQVTLRNVGFNLSGNFTCEVTTDSPFYTATAANILTVVELPHAPPHLWTERDRYDPGDILKANCTTPPSKPPPTITFFLNEILVGSSATVLHSTPDNLQWASKDLSIQVLPSHYHNGQLVLKCKAEVGALYTEESDIPLWSTRKEPIPERVTSPNSANHMQSSMQNIVTSLLLRELVVQLSIMLRRSTR